MSASWFNCNVVFDAVKNRANTSNKVKESVHSQEHVSTFMLILMEEKLVCLYDFVSYCFQIINLFILFIPPEMAPPRQRRRQNQDGELETLRVR